MLRVPNYNAGWLLASSHSRIKHISPKDIVLVLWWSLSSHRFWPGVLWFRMFVIQMIVCCCSLRVEFLPGILETYILRFYGRCWTASKVCRICFWELFNSDMMFYLQKNLSYLQITHWLAGNWFSFFLNSLRFTFEGVLYGNNKANLLLCWYKNQRSISIKYQSVQINCVECLWALEQ